MENEPLNLPWSLIEAELSPANTDVPAMVATEASGTTTHVSGQQRDLNVDDSWCEMSSNPRYIIVFSHPDDLHVKAVVDCVDAAFKVVIFDLANIGEWHVDCDLTSLEFSSIASGTNRIYIRDIQSIWWRKPTPVNVKMYKDGFDAFVFRETTDAIYGFLSIAEMCGISVVNHPFCNFSASMKPRQLALALSCGLLIPDTHITNSPTIAREFIGTAKCISKGVSLSWAINNGINYGIFVKEITQNKINSLNQISQCPATFQHLLQKKVDVRVVVVGCSIFYFNIKNSTSVDWRSDIDRLEYDYVTVDGPVINILIDFNKKLGLSFSVFDFVITSDNRMVFLETNPNGQWLWLDKHADGAIARALARHLTTPRN